MIYFSYDCVNSQPCAMKNEMDKQHIAYNAIALLYEGDYGSIKRAGNWYANNWEHAWNELEAVKGAIDVDESFRELETRGVRLILQSDAEYPPLLREIAHPPFGIYIRGTLPPTNTTSCAIVGTRKATEDGREIARAFAQALTRKGIVITSGLALGIDSEAHRGCLEEHGATVAVLASGLDSIYPKYHTRLAEEIVSSGGALVSEYPLHSPTYPSRFLERNRIVSGLSRGTLVIEAPSRSGSLATARFALDQNRDVFVVPGSIAHINFRGSHELIRKGATLTTEPEQILEEWGMSDSANSTAQFASEEEKRIMEFLQGADKPVSTEELVDKLNLSPAVVAQTVSFLIIRDMIHEDDSGYAIV